MNSQPIDPLLNNASSQYDDDMSLDGADSDQIDDEEFENRLEKEHN